MRYELARELKHAGFPQDNHDWYFVDGIRTDRRDTLTAHTKLYETRVAMPTLEELIEACGERFNSMGGDVRTNEWWAAERPEGLFVETFPLRASGATPTEAVARLWLALNKAKSLNK